MALSSRVFTDALRDMQRAMSAFEQPLSGSAPLLARRYPPTDIMETPKGYELHAELPGYDKKKIKIDLTEDRRTLILSGALEEEEEAAESSSGAASKKEEEQKGEMRQKEGAGTTLQESAKSGAPTMEGQGEEKKQQHESAGTDLKQAVKSTAEKLTGAAKKGPGTTHGQQVSSKRQEQQQKTPQWWVNERHHASFTRSYTFPCPVKADGIKARFEDGILKICAPKDVDNQPKKITID